MIEDVIVDGLAAHRLARLITTDVITSPLREAVLDRVWPSREGDEPRVATLITCPWCVGVWCALVALVARKVAPTLWRDAAHVLAAASLAGGIEEWFSR